MGKLENSRKLNKREGWNNSRVGNIWKFSKLGVGIIGIILIFIQLA